MSTLLILFFIRLAILIVQHLQRWSSRHGQYQAPRSYNFFYETYWYYAIDRRLFKRLTARFATEALPIIRRKIETELGHESWEAIQNHTKGSWFEFWLTYAHPQRLGIKNSHYSFYYMLFTCRELELLRQLDWSEVVRNIPAACWKNLQVLYGPILLHLGRGINIRRYPIFSYYSRRMAHAFHRPGNPVYLPYAGEGHLLLVTLGYDAVEDWSLRMLVSQLVLTTETPDRIKRLTPFVQRLIKYRQAGLLDDVALEKVAFYARENWPEKSKAIMKLKGFAQLERAADRYLHALAEKQQTEELLAEFGYQADQAWDSGHSADWNLCNSDGWYRIVALNSAVDLVEEGARMHHCVGSYVEECLSEESRIYSLRRRAHRKTKWRSVVTIEVQGKTVACAQGVLNTEVLPEHQSLLNEWFEREQFSIDWDDLME